eukprot:NODE_245_length_12995_cov_0.297922.p5 type:complete len:182 gc:universal NODE_245_length_12995_cov_0.297922:8986-9531(+)
MGFKSGTNSKASAAKEKKKEVQKAKEKLKQEQLEEELKDKWEKGSKKVSKRELELEKRQQQIFEKKEREEILRKEQASIKSYAAKNVADAIDLFQKEKVDRHPERRVKAAFEAYKVRRLKELRSENSTLRLSQLEEIIWKEFKKSPDNPMNQTNASYNTKQVDLDKMNEELSEKKLEGLEM